MQFILDSTIKHIFIERLYLLSVCLVMTVHFKSVTRFAEFIIVVKMHQFYEEFFLFSLIIDHPHLKNNLNL
jgi:hypothetical protein